MAFSVRKSSLGAPLLGARCSAHPVPIVRELDSGPTAGDAVALAVFPYFVESQLWIFSKERSVRGVPSSKFYPVLRLAEFPQTTGARSPMSNASFHSVGILRLISWSVEGYNSVGQVQLKIKLLNWPLEDEILEIVLFILQFLKRQHPQSVCIVGFWNIYVSQQFRLVFDGPGVVV